MCVGNKAHYTQIDVSRRLSFAMGFFSWIGRKVANIGRKVIGNKAIEAIQSLGKKAAGAVRNLPGIKQAVDVAQKGLNVVGNLAGKAASKVLDTDIAKNIVGGITKGAGALDSVTGGALGLKRAAEGLESDLRSGKLAKRAALGPAGFLI